MAAANNAVIGVVGVRDRIGTGVAVATAAAIANLHRRCASGMNALGSASGESKRVGRHEGHGENADNGDQKLFHVLVPILTCTRSIIFSAAPGA